MDYKEFLEVILNELKQRIGLEADINIRKIMKNNSLELDGMTIMKKGEHVSPTIYLNSYYEDYEKGMTFEEVIDNILSVYSEARVPKDVDMNIIQNYDQAKDRIVYKLVHYDKNRKLLSEIPHFEFLNMAIVFYHLLHHDTLGNAMMLIHNTHMRLWNIDPEELYKIAQRNTPRLLPPSFCSMQQMMRELFVEDLKNTFDGIISANRFSEESIYGKDDYIEDFVSHMMEEAVGRYNPVPMFVLTNKSRSNGAAAILYEGELDKIGRQLGEDFYILPSSVHEVIIVPMSCGHNREELRKMVKEINLKQVAQEEFLSDHVYVYCRKIKEILM